MTAGYSGTPLPKKLGIKEGMRIALLHAPDGFEETIGVPVQHGLKKTDDVDLAVGFITERAHFEKNWPWLSQTLAPNGVFWVAWPKKASKVPTDMTEDVIREVVLPTGWVDVKVCAIDEIWSGLKLVLRKELR